MNAAKKPHALAGILKPKAAPEPEKPAKAARGSAERPALTLRVNSREDWLEIRDFCARQGKSINEVMLEGFAEMQKRAGVKPISTKPE